MNFSTISTCKTSGEVKPIDQSLESLRSEVIYFLLFAVFLRCSLSISVTRPISNSQSKFKRKVGKFEILSWSLASLSGDHNASRCGRDSLSVDH